MRLKPEKVETLAKKMVRSFAQMKKFEFLVAADQVEGAIKRVFIGDLKREDDLEREAEAILQQYRQRIDLQNMSYNTLVAKTKQELARKRKIIL